VKVTPVDVRNFIVRIVMGGDRPFNIQAMEVNDTGCRGFHQTPSVEVDYIAVGRLVLEALYYFS
jgi:hypothetical protein